MKTNSDNGTTIQTALRPATLGEIPERVRQIAMLRGLGYSYRQIAGPLQVTPQAVSLMLTRHRRSLKSLRDAMELNLLSARAVNCHAAAFLATVRPLLPESWRVGPAVIVRQGRVAVGDAIGAALGATGATFANVFKMVTYVVDLTPEKAAAVRVVRNRNFGDGPYPASTMVGVTSLVHPDMLIEVEVIAALD